MLEAKPPMFCAVVILALAFLRSLMLHKVVKGSLRRGSLERIPIEKKSQR